MPQILASLAKRISGSLLRFINQSYNHCFTRYILLAWQQHCNTDERSLGGLFMHLADEFNELDCAVVLTTLLDLLADISANASQKIRKFIDCQLLNGFAGLPNYIKCYLPNLVCKS
jgi:hypothetical protein